MIYLGIIEDDAVVRETLVDFFRQQPDFTCLLSAGSVEEFLLQWEPDLVLDVVLSDIGLPGKSGIKGIPLLKKRAPGCQVIMLTVYDDPEKLFQALCAGANGYLLKHTPLLKIKEGLLTAMEGGAPMSPGIAAKVVAYFHPKTSNSLEEKITPREAQVLRAVEEGLTNKEIAIRLSISLETVKSHIKNIYQKLEVNSRHLLIKGGFGKTVHPPK
ncbi:response regulator transcription factor [Chitinophaga arvensicola]|uniref:DNA-binding response regulator, NarL/FixJ family, contains REC and HTH domains n=1 Tax=Chitinophaga arvensicola TaxID=29529 RepID=A0A1I0REF5_9BACT|nr:response regulator transcription factor [Chitinophaga arvensicola]SEW39227.1 DNA-binding response regulator, NarL/FixJ family, contains REC and HTH domains [Chitinophaga arvensicola]